MNAFSKRIPELDGIRGMAILLVLIQHYVSIQSDSLGMPRMLRGVLHLGWTGVDLFFVLSGFLIGGILLDAKDSENYFQVFYIRRFYRIIPLYVMLCVWSFVAFHASLSTHEWLFEGPIPWYAYLTLGQNFWMAKLGSLHPIQLSPTWSLAVEEQFYLVIPLVIWVFSRKSLPYILCAGVILAPLLRLAIWFGANPGSRAVSAYALAFCRMDALLLGVLAAYAVRNADCLKWVTAHKNTIGATSITLGAGLLVFNGEFLTDSFFGACFGYTWIALLYLSVLLLAITQRGNVSRFFRLRPLTELGILAYGLYLFQLPILGLVYGLAGEASPALKGPSSFGLTVFSAALLFLLAQVSWRYFEKPLLRRGHRYQYRRNPTSIATESPAEFEVSPKL